MEKQYTIDDIQGWDRFTRANFINSLSGFKSASLIGTADKQGRTNLAIFSNIVHLGADPALIGFVNRPREAAPHTLANIESTGVYTINHIHSGILRRAHQTSAKYADGESEFEATGLTAHWVSGIEAPFVKESVVRYALKLVEVLPVTHNRTFFVIGAITDVFVDTEFMEPDGFLALERAGSVTSLGLDGYYAVNRLDRLPYAKRE